MNPKLSPDQATFFQPDSLEVDLSLLPVAEKIAYTRHKLDTLPRSRGERLAALARTTDRLPIIIDSRLAAHEADMTAPEPIPLPEQQYAHH